MSACPLCREKSGPFCRVREKEYRACDSCGGIFLTPPHHLSASEEKRRYSAHNNDVDDPRYQEFVRPVVEAVTLRCGRQQHGLDFGCGPGPVISKMLKDRGYRLAQYDPFFSDRPALLSARYDFIICSEVIEHFREPAKEFKLLRSLLKPGGRLFCQTERYSPEIDFAAWYYKNDPTHVFFYQERTLAWIRDNFGFTGLTVTGRLSTLTAADSS